MAGLLVSVRDALEARQAMLGGADWIDVKEPRRGALGCADLDVLNQVGREVGGSAPCSAAAGELMEDDPKSTITQLPSCYCLAKVGLAWARQACDWQRKWSECFAAAPTHIKSVAVVYADWRTAQSPSPSDILHLATVSTSQYVLIDTFDKAQGDLFDCFEPSSLAAFCRDIRSASIGLVLAGSLDLPTLARALDLAPDFIAVRGAACTGDRSARIDINKVRRLRFSIDAHTTKQIAKS